MKITIKNLYQIEKMEGELNRATETKMMAFASGWMIDEGLIPFCGIEVDAEQAGDKYLVDKKYLVPSKWTK